MSVLLPHGGIKSFRVFPQFDSLAFFVYTRAHMCARARKILANAFSRALNGNQFTVNFELYSLEQSLSGVFAIADKVACGGSRSEDVSGEIYVFIGVLGVDSAGSVDNTGRLLGWVKKDVALVISGQIWRESRDCSDCCAHGVKFDVDNHVVNKVSELWNGELNRSAENGGSCSTSGLVVFKADRCAIRRLNGLGPFGNRHFGMTAPNP